MYEVTPADIAMVCSADNHTVQLAALGVSWRERLVIIDGRLYLEDDL